jgi:hypothetical protein
MGYLVDAGFSRQLAEWRDAGGWPGPTSKQELRLRLAAADTL